MLQILIKKFWNRLFQKRSNECIHKTEQKNKIKDWPFERFPNNLSSIDSNIDNTVSSKNRLNSRFQASAGNRKLKDFQEYKTVDIDNDLSNQLNRFLKKHKGVGAVSIILKMFKQLDKSELIKDKKIKDLNELLVNNTSTNSRLVVRPNGDLYLSDYNIEIKLTPLQKTVYIFFLNKPQGILFKDLPDYKKDFEKIYMQISSRTKIDDMTKSIEDLANPYSNSMSEKCSRIKEAFVKNLDESTASQYIITGERNGVKKIMIDRTLVSFE